MFRVSEFGGVEGFLKAPNPDPAQRSKNSGFLGLKGFVLGLWGGGGGKNISTWCTSVRLRVLRLRAFYHEVSCNYCLFSYYANKDIPVTPPPLPTPAPSNYNYIYTCPRPCPQPQHVGSKALGLMMRQSITCISLNAGLGLEFRV